MYGLPPVSSFNDLTNDSYTRQMLTRLYTNIDNLDAYVGGILENAESTLPKFATQAPQLGTLFAHAIRDVFERVIAGDRLFFMWDAGLRTYVAGETVAKLIERNTNVTNLTSCAFCTEKRGDEKTQTNTFTVLGGRYKISWRPYQVLFS